MKKRKFNLLLNIATICLCVSAIAFGVYSAKNASLNVTGTVGFQAHNCDVYVYGTVAGGTQTGGSANFGTESSYVNVHDTTKNSWSLGTLMFDDLGDVPEGKNANDIVITLKMYNQSKFDVKATFNTNFLTANYSGKVKATASPATMVLSANKTLADAKTMTITLSLETTTDFTGTTFSGETLVSFEKYESIDSTYFIGTGALEGKLCKNLGFYNSNEKPSGKGSTDYIVWYAYAYSSDGTNFTSLASKKYTDVSQVEAGHYKFVCQYVFGGYYNESGNYVAGHNYDTDNWANSSSCTYLKNTFATETLLSSDSSYTKDLVEKTISYTYNAGTAVTYTGKFWLLSTDDVALLCGELVSNIKNGMVSEAGRTALKAYGLSAPNGGNVMSTNVASDYAIVETNTSSTFYYVDEQGAVQKGTRGMLSPQLDGVRPACEIIIQ